MTPRSHFSTRPCSASHDITRLSPHCCYHSLICLVPRFVSNRAYLGSFGTASWACHEFERTRGNVTEYMERNISRHHAEFVWFNARSYRIVHLHLSDFNRVGGWGREVRASDRPQGVLPENWGGTKLNCTVTCMVLKATANDRRTSAHLIL
ncbi:uncharacterized protein TNCV_4906131 [Trichonephila clavipes]|uniref:Uncharacterized protein n=1 Tax=Trichonephila clavipes TaxID=2585209 RepID=A0A8X6RZS3_TRICX|nr:uncharacterized protein TNCV_4906131 [Trichonephila clavipes]